ncbi:glycosyltransferase family 2 protein [Paenibacillus elgii]|uniref:glycosyltransferase family 2 protein n=1 Tax=Paenibacillus elgii TaxID=189691 RepID=UPI002D7B0A86|nr:glycosyltransferase family 2 protein [Paenibacillus elgii]
MKFSLILATCGERYKELTRFLDFLKLQTYKSFELIIIDQNDHNKIENIVSEYYQLFPVVYLKCEKGLSKARNLGIKQSKGEIVCFPDDDCWYNENLLKQIYDLFSKDESLYGVTGSSIDPDGSGEVSKFQNANGVINIYSVWKQAISITIFLRKEVIDSIGFFDESLGVGSNTMYKSGEETDLIIRAIDKKWKIYYFKEVVVYHPNPVVIYDQNSFQRAYGYGCGFGRVLRKHSYPILFVLKCFLRPFGGAIVSLLSLNISKSRYHLKVLKGRVYGYFF